VFGKKKTGTDGAENAGAKRLAEMMAKKGRFVDADQLAAAMKAGDQSAIRAAMGVPEGTGTVITGDSFHGDPAAALARLEPLHENGTLSDEQYEALRQKLLSASSGSSGTSQDLLGGSSDSSGNSKDRPY
jgi:hypothetical protein